MAAAKICSIDIKWMSINPLAYADAGEAKPFSSLIISIGVIPCSLHYDTAVAAATVVKNILAEVGFPAIKVAFVELVVTHSTTASTKLLSFDPLLNNIPDLRKPFTAALGLSIAPLKYPHLEARPPLFYTNTGTTRRTTSQAAEKIIALGSMGYNNAVKAMMGVVVNGNGTLSRITNWPDMNPAERERTFRVLVARNQIRLVDQDQEQVTASGPGEPLGNAIGAAQGSGGGSADA